jgi:glucose/arabinose dehydrogenase
LLKSLQVNPDAITHFGGVMVIGKDNTVYAVAGDQDNLLGTNILQNQFGPPDDTGVILPVDPTGPYYAIGIRNSFGLAIDPITGNMWATENGPSKFDEVNLFMPKSNSGWNSHMGPLKESRINHFIVSDPPLAGVGGIIKSHIQLFLTSIYSIFFLSEQYEYSEPEFSWKGTIAPTAINFAPSSFGKYENWLFVGDCNFGNIYKFELNSSRISFVFEDPNLKDLVVHEGDSMEEIHFGKGFGCITDIEFKDEYMYLVSLTEGTIFRISLTDLI